MDTAVAAESIRTEQWLGTPARPMAGLRKNDFEKAVAKCHGVSPEIFIDEFKSLTTNH